MLERRLGQSVSKLWKSWRPRSGTAARAIAGTLINVGRGYWPEGEVEAILRAEDRTRAGPTAPAQGLFLMRVTYER